MRIGIDYTAAIRQGAGIGRYTRNLIRSLAVLDRENDYRLFVAGGLGAGDGLGPWPANYSLRPVPVSDRWLNIVWQRLRVPVPVQVVTGHLDLFHSPDFVLPPTGRVPTLLTVHDLSFLRVPECFVPGFCRYLGRAVTRAVRRAGLILADSESTRRDLLELLGAEPQRVKVLYPGVEARFRPITDVDSLERVRSRYDLPRRFVLGLGTIQPRKNYPALVNAFAELLQAGREAEDLTDLHLVIAGAKGWMHENTFRAIADTGLSDRVRYVGFVEDVDLPAIYSLATVFAFPSLYEGFGLPVLEAMACGTPVVCAGNSSLPEVAGDAALIVPATAVNRLAEALFRLLTDSSLRKQLVDGGQRRAMRFRWTDSASKLLELYEEILPEDRKGSRHVFA